MRKVKVNLTKYVATEPGCANCPAVITSNGRIKQDMVVVNGKEERHAEGAYYLDWRRDGVRVQLSVGKNAQDALTQRDRRTFELNAAAHGVELASSVVPISRQIGGRFWVGVPYGIQLGDQGTTRDWSPASADSFRSRATIGRGFEFAWSCGPNHDLARPRNTYGRICRTFVAEVQH